MRFCIPLLAAAILAAPVHAGGEALAGNWKVTIFEDSKYLNFWLLKLQANDGKLTGEAETIANIPETTITNVQVNGDLVTLTFKLANGVTFNFEGKLPRAGGKKILGSITRATASTPAFLEATQAKNAFEVNVELVTRTPSDPRVFSTLLPLIAQAKDKKIAPREVQEWIDGVLKTAESHGPTWQTDYTLRVVSALETPYPAVAAEVAVKLEKSFDAKTPRDSQLRLLTSLENVYRAAGQSDEAAQVAVRVRKLELDVYAENAKATLNFEIEPYAGKVSQPALVELFTGAQCPPCVAADIGFDGLGKAFKETDVVLLQYHLHIPAPDALCNADVEARADFYSKSLRGTPALYFNGKLGAPGGGGRDGGEFKYKEYRELVEKLLATKPGGKLTLAATRKGDVIKIQTSASEVADAKADIKLRLVLVEDWARYKGRNGLTFHHRIVRAMPGGAAGFTVKESLAKSVTVDVAELRVKIAKYLDDYGKNEPFPDAQRPLALHNLHVAAFLQNDETGEVLQAMSVPVKSD